VKHIVLLRADSSSPSSPSSDPTESSLITFPATPENGLQHHAYVVTGGSNVRWAGDGHCYMFVTTHAANPSDAVDAVLEVARNAAPENSSVFASVTFALPVSEDVEDVEGGVWGMGRPEYSVVLDGEVARVKAMVEKMGEKWDWQLMGERRAAGDEGDEEEDELAGMVREVEKQEAVGGKEEEEAGD
jgi:hypothetical protein